MSGGGSHEHSKDPKCPRCHLVMQEKHEGEAHIDVCERCGGTFFDQGEMFAAYGTTADPSYWDRDETGGVASDGELECPRCESHMLVQQVAYGGSAVEIDRCGHCGGLWLDRGEADKVLEIGAKMVPVVAAERDRHRAELDAMEDPDFRGGLLYRFLKIFKRG